MNFLATGFEVILVAIRLKLGYSVRAFIYKIYRIFMNSRIRKLLPFGISAAFITPLVLLNNYIFPFIVPKILFFRSLVMILLVGYLVLLISDFKRFRPRMTFLTISILLFWLSFAISTFSGVDWYHSFWDNHERMLGLFTITHYTLLYLIASSTFETERDWTIVFRSALLLGSAVMIVGVWQKFVDPQALLNNGSWRVSATLGNSIYYSGYGLFLLFLGVIEYFREQSRTWKWISLAVAVLGFLGIFFGGTRGAILGLIAGCAALSACYIFLSREKSRGRTIVTYAAIAGIILLVILFVFRQTTFVSGIPGLGRLLNTSLSLDAAESTRPMAWKVAIESWKHRPIFGWGPNNFYYAFNEYFNPQFLKFGWSETWFDNAHSVIFNTLAVQGIVGISVYVLIYIAAIVSMILGVRKNKISKHIGFISVGFLVAHFVSLTTVFENPTSYLCFFVFLAFISFMTREVIFRKKIEEVQAIPQAQKKISPRNVSSGLIIFISFIALCIIYVTDIAPGRANKATIVAIQKVYAGTADAKVYDDALVYSTPHLDDIRNDISRTVFGSLPTLVQQGKTEQATALFTATVTELKKNQLLHPLDVRVHFTLSQVFEFGFQATQNKDFLTQSEVELRRSVALSPKRQQLIYALAQNLSEQGKFAEAEQLLLNSIADYDKIGEGYVRLALVYAADNKPAEAKKIAEKVKNWFGDPTIYQLDPNWKPLVEQLLSASSTKSQ